MAYNLASPNGLVEPCDLPDLEAWFTRELDQVRSSAERTVLATVSGNLESFVCWASEALLLWPGCDRVPEPGKKQKYFKYPPHIREMAKAAEIRLDTRPNGPAIAAFLIAGGMRPERFGSSNAWSIHHVYSGKFPYPGADATTHATKEPRHFTQAAGLVAAHPVADALVDEFPFFTWYLRAQALRRFGYDPDGVFSASQDEHGFVEGYQYRVVQAPA